MTADFATNLRGRAGKIFASTARDTFVVIIGLALVWLLSHMVTRLRRR